MNPRPWRELLPEARDDFLCALEQGRLRLTLSGQTFTLTVEQTQTLRSFFARLA